MKSANYVVLFEDTDILRNLVNAIRYVCNKDNMSRNSKGNMEFFLRFGTIPILAMEQGVNTKDYLPFSEVLDWDKAIIITTTKGLQVWNFNKGGYISSLRKYHA